MTHHKPEQRRSIRRVGRHRSILAMPSGAVSLPWKIWYDFSNPANYLLNTGAIETIYNLGTLGAGYNLSQSVHADRPVPDGNGYADFTAAGEWFDADVIAAALTGIDDITYEVEFDVAADPATNNYFFTAIPASGSGQHTLSYLVNGRVRIGCRTVANTISQQDCGVGAWSGGTFSGSPRKLRFNEAGGVVEAFVDDVSVGTRAWNAGFSDATFARGCIGGFRNGGGVFSQPFIGKIKSFKMGWS